MFGTILGTEVTEPSLIIVPFFALMSKVQADTNGWIGPTNRMRTAAMNSAHVSAACVQVEKSTPIPV